ncbi:MAG: DUF4440 domain-containing protein [Bacteroidetes bacterium]|nr:DUF4440 domain-containing protein [Bacteroidota bacterium]
MKNLILFSSILAVACQSGTANLEAEVAALTAAAKSYNDNAAALNLDAAKLSYSNTARMMAPDAETVKGKEAIGSFIDGFKNLKELKVGFTDVEVSIDPDGKTGYSTAIESVSYNAPNGGTVMETVRDIHVWKKQADGSWKIELDTWNQIETPGGSVGGVYQYVPPLKGQSTLNNGRFVFLVGPSDGKGPMKSRAGNYTISGDTVTSNITYATDLKEIGTSFRWRIKSWAGDTATVDLFDEKGVVNNTFKSVRVSR